MYVERCEWIRGLGWGFTNPVETGGVLEMPKLFLPMISIPDGGMCGRIRRAGTVIEQAPYIGHQDPSVPLLLFGQINNTPCRHFKMEQPLDLELMIFFILLLGLMPYFKTYVLKFTYSCLLYIDN